MLEMMTTETVMQYVHAIRHALDNGDIEVANMALDLLQDIITGDESWKADDDDYDDDDCDTLAVIGNTCDYCNCEVDHINPLPNSMFWACDTCYSQYLVG